MQERPATPNPTTTYSAQPDCIASVFSTTTNLIDAQSPVLNLETLFEETDGVPSQIDEPTGSNTDQQAHKNGEASSFFIPPGASSHVDGEAHNHTLTIDGEERDMRKKLGSFIKSLTLKKEKESRHPDPQIKPFQLKHPVQLNISHKRVESKKIALPSGAPRLQDVPLAEDKNPLPKLKKFKVLPKKGMRVAFKAILHSQKLNQGQGDILENSPEADSGSKIETTLSKWPSPTSRPVLVG